ncbi:MAG: T9SS type A sorting domain-containing protein [Elusimicrobia bacterium]|nr:T9SS type A sorting domain-containing protein [Elusimicrobiota bacterium]
MISLLCELALIPAAAAAADEAPRITELAFQSPVNAGQLLTVKAVAQDAIRVKQINLLVNNVAQSGASCTGPDTNKGCTWTVSTKALGLAADHGYPVKAVAIDSANQASSPVTKMVAVVADEAPRVAELGFASPVIEGQPFSVRAVATDAVGVARMDLHVNNVLQPAPACAGPDTNKSCSWSVSTRTLGLAPGRDYPVKAVAVDSANRASGPLIKAVTIVADEAPRIAALSFESPVTEGQSFTVKASATDAVGIARITLHVNNVLQGTPSCSGPDTGKTCAWNVSTKLLGLAPGRDYPVKAVAVDSAGKTSEPAIRSVAIAADAPPRIAELAFPSPVTEGQSFTVQALAQDALAVARINLYVNNVVLGAPSCTGPDTGKLCAWSVSTKLLGLAAGRDYPVKAVAVDSAGRASEPVAKRVVIVADEAPRVAELSFPSSVTAGQDFAAKASAQDAIGVVRIQLYVNNVSIGAPSCSGPDTEKLCAWNVSTKLLGLAAGRDYPVKAVAVDSANQASAPVTKTVVIVADEAPRVAELSFPDPVTVGQTFTVKAVALDAIGIARVNLQVNDVAMPAPSCDGPATERTCSWLVSTKALKLAADFGYPIKAVAVDSANRTSAPMTKMVTLIADEPPRIVELAFESPVIEGLAFPVQALARDAVGVKRLELRVNGAAQGAPACVGPDTDKRCTWSVSTAGLGLVAGGSYAITALAVDSADMTSEPATRTVAIVPDEAPSIVELAFESPVVEGQRFTVKAVARDAVGIKELGLHVNETPQGAPSCGGPDTEKLCTWSVSSEGLGLAGGGSYPVTAFAVDTGGKQSDPVTRLIAVSAPDRQKPVLTQWTSPQGPVRRNERIPVSFVADDGLGGSGIRAVEATVNAGSTRELIDGCGPADPARQVYTCEGTLAFPAAAPGLDTVGIQLHVIDAAGNVLDSEPRLLELHLPGPATGTVSVKITKPDADSVPAGSVRLEAVAVGATRLRLSLIDTAKASIALPPCPEPSEDTIACGTSVELAAGSYALDALAERGGEAATTRRAFTVGDRTAPELTLEEPARDPPPIVKGSPARVRVTANAVDAVGVTRITLLIGDGSLRHDCELTSRCTWEFETGGLALGRHAVSAQARDAAGNVGIAKETRTISIIPDPDALPPSVTLAEPSADLVLTRGSTFIFSASANDGTQGAVSGVRLIEARLRSFDTAAGEPELPGQLAARCRESEPVLGGRDAVCAKEAETKGLAPGRYWLDVSATDDAGNVGRVQGGKPVRVTITEEADSKPGPKVALLVPSIPRGFSAAPGLDLDVANPFPLLVPEGRLWLVARAEGPSPIKTFDVSVGGATGLHRAPADPDGRYRAHVLLPSDADEVPVTVTATDEEGRTGTADFRARVAPPLRIHTTGDRDRFPLGSSFEVGVALPVTPSSLDFVDLAVVDSAGSLLAGTRCPVGPGKGAGPEGAGGTPPGPCTARLDTAGLGAAGGLTVTAVGYAQEPAGQAFALTSSERTIALEGVDRSSPTIVLLEPAPAGSTLILVAKPRVALTLAVADDSGLIAGVRGTLDGREAFVEFRPGQDGRYHAKLSVPADGKAHALEVEASDQSANTGTLRALLQVRDGGGSAPSLAIVAPDAKRPVSDSVTLRAKARAATLKEVSYLWSPAAPGKDREAPPDCPVEDPRPSTLIGSTTPVSHGELDWFGLVWDRAAMPAGPADLCLRVRGTDYNGAPVSGQNAIRLRIVGFDESAARARLLSPVEGEIVPANSLVLLTAEPLPAAAPVDEIRFRVDGAVLPDGRLPCGRPDAAGRFTCLWNTGGLRRGSAHLIDVRACRHVQDPKDAKARACGPPSSTVQVVIEGRPQPEDRDWSAMGMLSEGEGTITAPDLGVQVTLPDFALQGMPDRQAFVRIGQETPGSAMPAATSGSVAPIGPAYSIVAFDRDGGPMTRFPEIGVCLPIDAAPAEPATRLGIAYRDDAGRWVVTGSVDAPECGGVRTVGLDHLTTFAVVSVPQASGSAGPADCGLSTYPYPNPAAAQVTLVAAGSGIESARASVFDLTGRLLHRAAMGGGPGPDNRPGLNASVNVGGLAAGGYLYVVEASRGGSLCRAVGKFAVLK